MIYFPQKGPVNTDETVEIALARAGQLGIKHLVVASCTGNTAEKLISSGYSIVCVTHQVGFKHPGEDEMSQAVREKLSRKGVKILTTTHLLAGVDRSLRFKFQGVYPAEIIAASLRIFGQGMKVCLEITSMAMDAGMIPFGEEVIAIAGSGSGADTAIVVSPAHGANFFDNNVKEILCMPRGY